MLDEKYEMMQENFMMEYFKEFEEGEENKLEYMNIFMNYQNLFEEYVSQVH